MTGTPRVINLNEEEDFLSIKRERLSGTYLSVEMIMYKYFYYYYF